MEECAPGLGEDVVLVTEGGVDVQAPAARACEPRLELELAVDPDGPPVADEDARGDGREPVPGREQPARLVERGGDEAAVDDAGPALVALVERERRALALEPLLPRLRQSEPLRIVAAPPAGRIVVGRDHQTFSKVPRRSSCS